MERLIIDLVCSSRCPALSFSDVSFMTMSMMTMLFGLRGIFYLKYSGWPPGQIYSKAMVLVMQGNNKFLRMTKDESFYSFVVVHTHNGKIACSNPAYSPTHLSLWPDKCEFQIWKGAENVDVRCRKDVGGQEFPEIFDYIGALTFTTLTRQYQALLINAWF